MFIFLSLFAFFFTLLKGGTILYDYRYKMTIYNYDPPPAKFPTEFPYNEILPKSFFEIEAFYKIGDKINSSDEEFIPVFFKKIPLDVDHLPFVVIFDPGLTFGVMDQEDLSLVEFSFYINDKKVFKSEQLKDCIVAYWAVKKTNLGRILYSGDFWISPDECTIEERRMAKENHIVFRHAYNGFFNSVYNFMDNSD